MAKLIREAMDAADLTPADVERRTGLDRRHISQILNRAANYNRPPKVDTLQALAKIPGLSMVAIAEAIAESTGMPLPSGPVVVMTPLRRSVHAVVDKIPEDELTRALQILTALL